MADPAEGPYEVVTQRTTSSVVCKDPQTGELVDNGANIPLDQILAGPRRAPLVLEKESDVRSVGAMIRGEGSGDQGRQSRPGKRAGWGNLSRLSLIHI